jgi:hypothetical protein
MMMQLPAVVLRGKVRLTGVEMLVVDTAWIMAGVVADVVIFTSMPKLEPAVPDWVVGNAIVVPMLYQPWLKAEVDSSLGAVRVPLVNGQGCE